MGLPQPEEVCFLLFPSKQAYIAFLDRNVIFEASTNFFAHGLIFTSFSLCYLFIYFEFLVHFHFLLIQKD